MSKKGEKRQKILDLTAAGKSAAEISKTLGGSLSNIYKVRREATKTTKKAAAGKPRKQRRMRRTGIPIYQFNGAFINEDGITTAVAGENLHPQQVHEIMNVLNSRR